MDHRGVFTILNTDDAYWYRLVAGFALLLLCLSANAQPRPTTGFIANKGQWKGAFDYKLNIKPGKVYLSPTRFSVDLQQRYQLARDTFAQSKPKGHHQATLPHHGFPRGVNGHVYQLHFLGAQSVNPQASESLPQYHNYFYGSKPERWQGGVGLYQTVTYPNLYKGIDLQYHFNNQLKYEFTVRPGAAVSDIQIHLKGADSLWLEEGHLMIKTSLGMIREKAPYSYQEIEDSTQAVPSRYKLRGDTLTFAVSEYDARYPLIIDPELKFSTYIGSTQDNFGFTATFSADNGGYVGGIVFGGPGFPTTVGAYQDTFGGGNVDAVISRFNANGSQLMYSTFLGGSGNDIPLSLLEAPQGQLFIMGNTGSPNFPTTPDAYDTSYFVGPKFNNAVAFGTNQEGADIFVARLSSNGKTLEASTLVGDSLSDGLNRAMDEVLTDAARGEVILDTSGNVYVASVTNSPNFPNTGQGNSSLKGFQDGVVFSLTPGLKSLRWSTLIGGNQNDAVFSAKIAPSGRLYATGTTESNLSLGNSNSWQQNSKGGREGFIVELNPANGAVVNFTHNGDTANQMNYLLDFDRNGEVYVTGTTRGHYPIVDTSLFHIPGSAHFIQQFSPDLSSSKRSTLIGDGKSDRDNFSPTAMMVDNCGNVFLAGWGGIILPNSAGAMDSLPITANAFKANTDGQDFYFLILDASWQKINYASYFGENSNRSGDHVDGGTSRFRKDGTIYEAVCASCRGTQNFPTTPNAWSDRNLSTNCNMALMRFKLEADSAIARVVTDKDSSCVPFTANLSDLSFNSDILLVIDSAGTVDTLDSQNPQLTFNHLGWRQFQFVAVDTTCLFRDTTQLRFFGFQDTVKAQFTLSPDTCGKVNNYFFSAQPTASADEYSWQFGDGRSDTGREVSHQFRDTGTFSVSLIVKNKFCNLTDTFTRQVKIAAVDSLQLHTRYDPCESFSSLNLFSNPFPQRETIWRVDGAVVGRGDTLPVVINEVGLHRIELESRDTICDSSVFANTTLEIFDPFAPMQMPNIFTPNGDGINDFFGPTGVNLEDLFTSFSMKIYNRWGQEVYSTSRPAELWNGRYEGGAVTTGVYYYVLSYTNRCNQTFQLKGFTHLER